MELKFALLCDAANESKQGKTNIFGEFDTIWAQTFPMKWPRMVLVARFEAHVSEGIDHGVQLRLQNADGRDVIPATPVMQMRFASHVDAGRPARGQLIANMDLVQFPAPGDYSINILVDGHHLGSVPIVLKST